MIGVALSTFDATLRKVPVHRNTKPVEAFDGMERIGPHARAYIAAQGYRGDFADLAHHLPLKAFSRLTLDEITKIRFSSCIMMDSSVEDAYRNDPRYVILNKITNSMWRWGFNHGQWNEVVDAYNGIRDFTLDLPDFEVRLDYTTGHNECGYSEHSRTFLDGVFAFLIYYRGEHVMTVGFSLAGKRRILVQQVQLTKRRGNRFLFRMPANRIEFFLDRFRAAFSRFTLYLVDGSDVANKSLKSYRNGLENSQERLDKFKARAARNQLSDWDKGDDERYAKEIAAFAEKIAHLSADVERLAALYGATGRYNLGTALKINGLTHYRVEE
jgi:hypothetical protein